MTDASLFSILLNTFAVLTFLAVVLLLLILVNLDSIWTYLSTCNLVLFVNALRRAGDAHVSVAQELADIADEMRLLRRAKGIKDPEEKEERTRASAKELNELIARLDELKLGGTIDQHSEALFHKAGDRIIPIIGMPTRLTVIDKQIVAEWSNSHITMIFDRAGNERIWTCINNVEGISDVLSNLKKTFANKPPNPEINSTEGDCPSGFDRICVQCKCKYKTQFDIWSPNDIGSHFSFCTQACCDIYSSKNTDSTLVTSPNYLKACAAGDLIKLKKSILL